MGSKTEQNDLKILIESKNPILVIETHEELRAINLINQVAMKLNQPVFGWHLTEGLRRFEVDGEHFSPLKDTAEPAKCLRHIKRMQRRGIYVLCDFHPFIGREHPETTRLLRDIALDYAKDHQTIILISHGIKLPEELKKLSRNFTLSLPNAEELESIIRKEAARWGVENPGRKVRTDKKVMQRLIRNLTGLTRGDAAQVVRNLIYDDGAITETEVEQVNEARYKLLDLDGAVHYEYETAHFAEVGGMDSLKRWLELRRKVFLSETDTGLDRPKGILLMGVQGSGKSLAAKAVAGMWQIPLLRLDFGALYNKWHGESEKNLREALKLSQVMSPCVLWLDEIEKGLSTSDNDGGTSKRMLGTLLTFMQENKAPVFFVATANDISALPPELIRKGRFDELFFVDLPEAPARQEIFRIHLEKRKQSGLNFDLVLLAQSTEGFSGAEIEQAVVAGLYAAHYQESELSTDMILAEIEQTKPLSVVMAEKISALRSWANQRAVKAN
ncbi:AAA family ATPase [Kangiella sediminilitoris]|uniref:Uncharacterized AAA domain-containing protein ycf46 n=1 Tax=Kangiella sediminilitoris TaxID=1144748 RepID=A0A1B3BDT5_9GAMM|nr:AAA family ATPase [Kangiella sediminilitoris]AOE50857.1 AAA ATPase central domain protein [Kangiella sediminilitoris]